MHVYLAGRLCVEHDGTVVDERQLAGPHGRVLFAMLAAEHGTPLARELLAEELWAETPPVSWERSMRMLVSKLRAALRPLRQRSPAGLLEAGVGQYQFNLPDGGVVDLDAAGAAVRQAEASLAADELGRAQREALTACIISRGPFLPGADGPWATGRRRRLADQHARAREVVAEVLLRKGDHRRAAREAARAVQIDPCREGAYRQLMRAYAGVGDRGLALRAFDRCRQVLHEQLGADPSPDTQALHRLLTGQAPASRPRSASRPAPRGCGP